MADTLRAGGIKRRRPPIAAVFGLFTPLFNRPIARLAGSRYLPFWAVILHRGRRSGRAYRTPVAAQRTADGFVIPLAFGESADWCRNLLASGRAEIRWKDRTYTVVDPTIVEARSALAEFPPLARRLLELGLVYRVLRVRDAPPRSLL